MISKKKFDAVKTRYDELALKNGCPTIHVYRVCEYLINPKGGRLDIELWNIVRTSSVQRLSQQDMTENEVAHFISGMIAGTFGDIHYGKVTEPQSA